MSDEYKLLTDDERGHFRTWETLFESDGWALLTKELQAEVEQAPVELFHSVSSWEELLAARARIQAALTLLRYPDLIEIRKEQIIEERRMAAEDRLADAFSGV